MLDDRVRHHSNSARWVRLGRATPAARLEAALLEAAYDELTAIGYGAVTMGGSPSAQGPAVNRCPVSNPALIKIVDRVTSGSEISRPG
jgi:hypothetical protein